MTKHHNTSNLAWRATRVSDEAGKGFRSHFVVFPSGVPGLREGAGLPVYLSKHPIENWVPTQASEAGGRDGT